MVNAERAAELGRKMQINLDGKSVTSIIQVKFKVQALSSLRKIPKVNEKKLHINSLKLFNQLIIISQRDMTVETSLEYELTPSHCPCLATKTRKLTKQRRPAFPILA